MGDVADMILDGIICECCGVYIGDECGYPRRCRSCSKPEPAEKAACPICGKRVKSIGLVQHMTDAHTKKVESDGQ